MGDKNASRRAAISSAMEVSISMSRERIGRIQQMMMFEEQLLEEMVRHRAFMRAEDLMDGMLAEEPADDAAVESILRDLFAYDPRTEEEAAIQDAAAEVFMQVDGG